MKKTTIKIEENYDVNDSKRTFQDTCAGEDRIHAGGVDAADESGGMPDWRADAQRGGCAGLCHE